ncbi:TfuA-like protein [Amycolatopsis sp. cg9]|uniref:TfuA-like protein n=1 Tax=Amycolatopsis sp. cg9 TaxID=3238801 RepID=UPI003524D0E4
MTVHVYAGPSLTGSAVLELDGVCWHPPVAHGDLYRVRVAPGDSVLIVDGLYQHTAPARNKEIIELHTRGVPVYGAASIGALRACEHLGHGMAGLGSVFGWYRDGRLFSDADVALMHGDADVGYRAFTHALVSILSVTDRMAAAGRLDERTAEAIVEVARSVHFGSRTDAVLVAAAGGLAEPMRAVLAELDPDRLGDIKRIDAEQAVREILSGTAPNPLTDAVAVPDLTDMREWRLLHTPATTGPAAPTLLQVLTYAQLFRPDYPELHTRYVFGRLRPEYPGLRDTDAAPAWLSALTNDDLVARGVLSDAEARRFSQAELLERVLVRTFRLRSGRLVYEEFPAELAPDLTELATECAAVLELNEHAQRRNPAYHPEDLPERLIDAAFTALWATGELSIHALDRGFRTVEEFREQARPFFIAARAAVAMKATA